MLNFNPSPGDIRCNSLNASGTVITVPAGRTFCGDIALAASISIAGTAVPSVTVNGTNAEPASGTVVNRLSMTGLALTTVTDSNTIEIICRAPAENSITLDFATGGASSSSVTINGFLL